MARTHRMIDRLSGTETVCTRVSIDVARTTTFDEDVTCLWCLKGMKARAESDAAYLASRGSTRAQRRGNLLTTSSA